MPELILIFLVALLVFGPRKLPELGRSLGRGLAEFRKASEDLKRTIEDEIEQGKHHVSAVQDEVSSVRQQTADLRNTIASSVGGSAAAAPAPEAPRSDTVTPPTEPIRPA